MRVRICAVNWDVLERNATTRDLLGISRLKIIFNFIVLLPESLVTCQGIISAAVNTEGVH